MPFTIKDAGDVQQLTQILTEIQKLRAKVVHAHGHPPTIGISGQGASATLSNPEPTQITPILPNPSPTGTPEADIIMSYSDLSKHTDIFDYNPETEVLTLQPGAEGNVIRLYGEFPITRIMNPQLVGDIIFDFHEAIVSDLQFLQFHTNVFLTPDTSTISIYNLKRTGLVDAHFISGVKDVINCDLDITFVYSHAFLIANLHGLIKNTRLKISGAQASTCRCIYNLHPTAVIGENNIFSCPER